MNVVGIVCFCVEKKKVEKSKGKFILGSLQPIRLDVCRNGMLMNDAATKEWTKTSHIPKTMPNCTFKFCARVSEPYVNEGCETGLEIEIIAVLRDKFKFKVSFI